MERVLRADVISTLYPTYLHAWDPLIVHAAARHVLSPDEFAHEMTDERIEKYIVREVVDGPILGITTLTNDMAAIPWINADHYVARYPDASARGALFYLGYTFVGRQHRHSSTLLMMAEAVNQRLTAAGGVVGFDICAFNNEHGIGRRVARLFSSSDRIDELDTQSYYAADYQKLVSPSASRADILDTYHVLTLADRPDLVQEIWDLLGSRWPLFTLAGHPGHEVDLEKLLVSIPDHQVVVLDAYDGLCGVGLSAPIRWDGSVQGLPVGWDDAINRSAMHLERGDATNAICALSVTVSPEAKGHGIAARVITGLNQMAARVGAETLITPVRPNLKSNYPLITMERYLRWQTAEGETFDPWLRLHQQMGAEVLGIAPSSMTVTGSVREWERWLDEALPDTGDYVIAGGLVPLVVDREGDIGVYREPNVWVCHRPVG